VGFICCDDGIGVCIGSSIVLCIGVPAWSFSIGFFFNTGLEGNHTPCCHHIAGQILMGYLITKTIFLMFL